MIKQLANYIYTFLFYEPKREFLSDQENDVRLDS